MITTDINSYNIAEALDALTAGVKSYLKKDPKTGKYVLEEFYKNPFYLQGAPGIGKTEGVRQVAKKLGIGFVSFSLTHHTRNSLLGLPAICDRKEGEIGGKYTVYTMSEIIAKVYDKINEGFEEGILLLDEFPCTSPTVMPAMLAFLQTKNIGAHTLPEGWVIVLCGNPPEYNKHSQTFDAAVTDRLRTLNIAWDVNAFIRYAKAKDFHPQVLKYLELNPDSVYRIDDNSLVTCRGWENLSNELKLYEEMGEGIDYKLIRQFIKSDNIATTFFNYYVESLNINKSDIRDILMGKAGDDLVKKYSSADSSVRLNLAQLLQKNLAEETAIPFRKITRLDQLKALFSTVKDNGPIRYSPVNMVFLSPLDVLSHIIEHNGDCSGMCRQGGSFFGGISPLQLDLPDIWGDMSCVYELQELVKEMCSDEELDGCTEYRTPEDVKRVTERQTARLNKFLRLKSSELRKSWNNITKQIDNVFSFLEKINGGDMYTERFFYFIGHNPSLLRAVTEGNSKEYYKRLDDIYGGSCA